jgi:hypothetical protein
MSRTCTICTQPFAADVNAALQAGDSVREVARTFGIARATLDRHRQHTGPRQEAPDTGPQSDTGPAPGSHLAAAVALIGAVKVIRGDNYGPQDAAEAEHLRSLAILVDATPTNVAALRELRLTHAEFKRAGSTTTSDEQMDLAELVASLTGRNDGTYQRTFAAVLAAGADEDVARAAAEAATHPHTTLSPVLGSYHHGGASNGA